MNTSQASPACALGSTWRFEPYHTTSARPAPPPFTQGNTETMEGGELTWVGTDQSVHPEAALATLTKAWRRAGVVLLPTQATYRFRPESLEVTTKFALSEASAGWWRATGMSLRGFPEGWVASGASRKVRFPDA